MLKITDRITVKNIERRLAHINKNLAINGVKRKLALGQRYGRKYIDVYNRKGHLTGDAITSGRTGEVYEYLGGMQKSLNMISDAKYQKAFKREQRAEKRQSRKSKKR